MRPGVSFPAAACLGALSIAGWGGCSSGSGSSSDDTVVVFAAASLTSSFEEMVERFESQHRDVDIVTSFTGSNALAAQIAEGAPVDVFAAADLGTMERAVEVEAVGQPRVFATNSIEIIVPAGNPMDIQHIGDLADPDVAVSMCDPEVPCGTYASTVLFNGGVDVAPVSLEANVNGVATKVINGEVDAGLVYASTVGDVDDLADGVPIPPDANVTAEYFIAVGDDTNTAARDFVEFVMGADGQQVLADHGYGAP